MRLTAAEVAATCTKLGFAHAAEEVESEDRSPALAPAFVLRSRYVSIYGPTTGDCVRLGDTSLWIRVERDLTTPPLPLEDSVGGAGGAAGAAVAVYPTFGDECKFGGGKVLRDGMGQAAGCGDGGGDGDGNGERYDSKNDAVLDLVITNALILDHSGVYKADVGVRFERGSGGASNLGTIVGIGKAGNPDVMPGVTPGMVCGAGTETIAGEGMILTAGGIDAHVHFICPQLVRCAAESGLTTMLGGGTGPATGTNATTCTPSPDHVKAMLQATDGMAMNFAFTGKGNCSDPKPLRQAVEAGAVGLKLHEDWGTTPAAIRTCLGVAEEMDVQVTIHTDTLNESANVEDSIAAFEGRTIHTYHSEGAGGGHAPDIITVCGEENVIPSSTNPTRPYTVNTVDEHLDMLMVGRCLCLLCCSVD